MTKKDLAEKISAADDNLSLHRAEQIINQLVMLITEEVKKNQPVRISGLGTFILKEVKERAGVNPKTKERITIPAHKKIKFKPSDTLKKALKTCDLI